MYGEGVADGQSDKTRVDSIFTPNNGKYGSKENHQIASRFQPYRQPTICDNTRIIADLIVIYARFRFFNKSLLLSVCPDNHST